MACQSPFCRRRPCGTAMHHLIKRSHGGSDDHDNLLELCVDCHRLMHEGGDDWTGERLTGLQWQLMILRELSQRPGFTKWHALDYTERRCWRPALQKGESVASSKNIAGAPPAVPTEAVGCLPGVVVFEETVPSGGSDKHDRTDDPLVSAGGPICVRTQDEAGEE